MRQFAVEARDGARVLYRIPNHERAGRKAACARSQALRRVRSNSPASSNGGSISTTPRRSFGGSSDFSAVQPSSAMHLGLWIAREELPQFCAVILVQLVGDQSVAAAQETARDERAARIALEFSAGVLVRYDGKIGSQDLGHGQRQLGAEDAADAFLPLARLLSVLSAEIVEARRRRACR